MGDLQNEFYSATGSGIAVFDMSLGDFNIDTFRHAPYPGVAVTTFAVFMFIVPTVMMNALIAIMVSRS